MNSAQLIAWFVCLALGFFACVLAVHNMGQASLMRQRVEELEAEQAAVESAAGELKKIRGTLEDIEAKLGEARPSTDDSGGEGGGNSSTDGRESGSGDAGQDGS